jgi:hypothetical protein
LLTSRPPQQIVEIILSLSGDFDVHMQAGAQRALEQRLGSKPDMAVSYANVRVREKTCPA